jgi:putative aldouronate transport system substrate-binding protein
MKSIVRRISVFLLAAALLAVSCSCSSATAKPAASTGPAVSFAAAATAVASATTDPLAKYVPVDGKKYTITWTAYQTAPIDPKATMIKYWDDMFNVDIQVWNIEWSQWNEIMNVKLASGEVPDKIYVPDPGTFKKYAQQGILAEIPDAVYMKYAPDIAKSLDTDAPGVINYAKVDGKLYGFPNQLNTDGNYRKALVMRGDWLKNVGITTPPTTLDEYQDAFYKFTNNDPDKDGKKDTYGLSSDGMEMVFGAFGYIPNFLGVIPDLGPRPYWQLRDGKVVCAAVQPEMKQALQLLSKWYADGVIDPEFVTGENTGGYWAISQPFVNGRIGFTMHGNYYHYTPVLYEGAGESKVMKAIAAISQTAHDSLTFTLPPKNADGTMGVVPEGYAWSGDYTAIGKQVESDPGKMAKMLQIFNYTSASSYENYLTATYGIKGTNWEFDTNGNITVLGSWAQDDTLSNANGAGMVIMAETPVPFQIKQSAIGYDWAKANLFDQYGLRDLIQDTLPSEDKVETDLNKLRDEAYLDIITGKQPISYFDDFVKQWNDAGGSQLTQEANDWYANYLNNK